MRLLPPREGVCQICATDHDKFDPHNVKSLYYQCSFYDTNGRCPTWHDAMEHCTPAVQSAWKYHLKQRGQWTEPDIDKWETNL